MYAYALFMTYGIINKIKVEEKVLSKEFKEEYDEFTKNTTSKLIPFVF